MPQKPSSSSSSSGVSVNQKPESPREPLLIVKEKILIGVQSNYIDAQKPRPPTAKGKAAARMSDVSDWSRDSDDSDAAQQVFAATFDPNTNAKILLSEPTSSSPRDNSGDVTLISYEQTPTSPGVKLNVKLRESRSNSLDKGGSPLSPLTPSTDMKWVFESSKVDVTVDGSDDAPPLPMQPPPPLPSSPPPPATVQAIATTAPPSLATKSSSAATDSSNTPIDRRDLGNDTCNDASVTSTAALINGSVPNARGDFNAGNSVNPYSMASGTLPSYARNAAAAVTVTTEGTSVAATAIEPRVNSAEVTHQVNNVQVDDHKLHTTTDDRVLDVYACKDADTSHVSSTGTDLVVGRRGFTSHDELPDQRAAVSQTSASSGQSISIM